MTESAGRIRYYDAEDPSTTLKKFARLRCNPSRDGWPAKVWIVNSRERRNSSTTAIPNQTDPPRVITPFKADGSVRDSKDGLPRPSRKSVERSEKCLECRVRNKGATPAPRRNDQPTPCFISCPVDQTFTTHGSDSL